MNIAPLLSSHPRSFASTENFDLLMSEMGGMIIQFFRLDYINTEIKLLLLINNS